MTLMISPSVSHIRILNSTQRYHFSSCTLSQLLRRFYECIGVQPHREEDSILDEERVLDNESDDSNFESRDIILDPETHNTAYNLDMETESARSSMNIGY